MGPDSEHCDDENDECDGDVAGIHPPRIRLRSAEPALPTFRSVRALTAKLFYTPGTKERLDQPDYLARVLARIPAGRVGTIADVAAAVIYLASDAAGLVTGTVLPVDGGWTAQ